MLKQLFWLAVLLGIAILEEFVVASEPARKIAWLMVALNTVVVLIDLKRR